MDCANSGSLQSSSGGDEEYYDDSRAAASILMNTHSPSHLRRPISTAPPLFYSLPIPNYIQLQNPNTPCRPATMRSDPNPSSSSSTCIFQAPTKATVSRKRPRASRRDPTTVLTTDTTNFRAIVQHFTGIPVTPPFNKTSTASLSRRAGFFEPPYLKVEPPPSPFHHVSSSTATIPINYQLPLIQNPNSSSSNFPACCFLQSNPKFVFSSANAIASKAHEHGQDEDSFGVPTNIDDFVFIEP